MTDGTVRCWGGVGMWGGDRRTGEHGEISRQVRSAAAAAAAAVRPAIIIIATNRRTNNGSVSWFMARHEAPHQLSAEWGSELREKVRLRSEIPRRQQVYRYLATADGASTDRLWRWWYDDIAIAVNRLLDSMHQCRFYSHFLVSYMLCGCPSVRKSHFLIFHPLPTTAITLYNANNRDLWSFKLKIWHTGYSCPNRRTRTDWRMGNIRNATN